MFSNNAPINSIRNKIDNKYEKQGSHNVNIADNKTKVSARGEWDNCRRCLKKQLSCGLKEPNNQQHSYNKSKRNPLVWYIITFLFKPVFLNEYPFYIDSNKENNCYQSGIWIIDKDDDAQNENKEINSRRNELNRD